MKKSEMIKKLIKIEKQSGEKTTISMPYIYYLEKQVRLLEIGNVEMGA